MCAEGGCEESEGALCIMCTARPEYGDLLCRIDSLIAEAPGENPNRDHQWKGQENMPKYLRALDIDKRLSDLSIIHVAGTKGKGSTCAMVDAMLLSCGYSTGRFTSPHLFDIRERICLSGKLISEEAFEKYANWCWDRCAALGEEGIEMPHFFRFMTLLAFVVFLEENVDVVILEVGMGGRLDATNIIQNPVVCGITSLGYDHMEVLGSSLEMIAWEKAGIFKTGTAAITLPQKPEAMASLQKRAQEIEVNLSLAAPVENYVNAENLVGPLFSAAYQVENVALAIALVHEWERCKAAVKPGNDCASRLQELAEKKIPSPYLSGLKSLKWPGRASIVEDPQGSGNLLFFLDGAHTVESMEECAKWFATSTRGNRRPKNILLFNCTGIRDAHALLKSLQHTMFDWQTKIHHAIFAPLNSSKKTFTSTCGDEPKNLSRQHDHHNIWKMVNTELDTQVACSAVDSHDSCVHVCLEPIQPSLSAVIASLRQTAEEESGCTYRVLVTGSLFLVGDVLRLLKFSFQSTD